MPLPSSYGYRGDSGHKYLDDLHGEEYGPTFGETGDIVGCGFVTETRELFFTKNGAYLGECRLTHTLSHTHAHY